MSVQEADAQHDVRTTKAEIAQKRKDRAEANTAEAAKLKPYKRALKARVTPGEWPLDARTLDRADLDPGDVQAPPMPEPVSMRALRKLADRPDAPPSPDGVVKVDEHVTKLRRSSFEAEHDTEAAMRGPWTAERVDLWLVSAMTTLFRLPLNSRPAGYKTSMPAYVADFADMVARQENNSLRRMRGRLMRAHGPVSARDHRRMTEAADWQLRYLRDDPPVARVVGLGALWNAVPGKSIKKRIRESLGIGHSLFYKMRKEGLMRIAAGLTRDGKVAT